MNFHPKAYERTSNRGHDVCWLSEKTFKVVKEFVTAYWYDGYKGNAQDALEKILLDAQRAGDAGGPKGGPYSDTDPKTPVSYWAWWFLACCHTLEWYDPADLDKATKDAKAKLGANVRTGLGAV